ncbi:MAG: DNA replication and repair protein RecF [Vampirovibrionales bacterium]|nr:DNA replication and repair protein RecF [Vampirovibrionales bacterium]
MAYLQALRLVNFRNIQQATLAFSAGRNLILGQNGQGKTSLLEAITLLSHGKSTKASHDRELVGQRNPSLGLLIDGQLETTRLRFSLKPSLTGAGRYAAQLKRDETLVKRRSQWAGALPSVSFFTQDLALLRGSPADRRQWLDNAATQWQPAHGGLLAEVERILSQKSRLLKQLRDADERSHYGLNADVRADDREASAMATMSPTSELLMILNMQLASASASLLESRLSYLAAVWPFICALHAQLSDTRDGVLSMAYWPKGSLGSDSQPGDAPFIQYSTVHSAWQSALEDRLNSRMVAERARGACLIGPHRDDISIQLDGLDATTFASQGQQRSIAVALKLAERACLSATIQAPPVMLLDDVMAELDPDRQAFLLAALEENHSGVGQVFLTTTHLEQPAVKRFLSRSDCCQFTVSGGHFSESFPSDSSLSLSDIPAQPRPHASV